MKKAATVEERFHTAMASLAENFEVREGRPLKRLGLAISGGSDSMALMHLAVDWCRDNCAIPVALCFDHAIAGENSAAEAEYVRIAAENLGIACIVERANPPISAGGGKSIEMAARDARMVFFSRMRKAHALDAIATGHQRGDVAETVILRLLRGAGAAGISGLRPEGSGIIRPLLEIGREELRNWLKSRDITWMDDVANSNEAIPRCRVRRRVLPALAATMEMEADSIEKALAQSAKILRDEDSLLENLAQQWIAGHGGITMSLPLADLKMEHRAIAKRVARMWLLKVAGAEAAGYSFVDQLLNAVNGDAVNLPDGIVLRINDGTASIQDDAAPTTVFSLKVGGPMTAALTHRREVPGVWPAKCALSARAVEEHGPLRLSVRAPGDRMHPFGVDGSRKLQDIFVDMKISERERATWPVIWSGSVIAWLPGFRISAPFAVHDGEPYLLLEVAPL